MNSEKPLNQSSDFPGSFDHEETEINVTYEEITPEKDLSDPNQVIDKNRVREQVGQNKPLESADDIWEQQDDVEDGSQNDSPSLNNSSSDSLNLDNSDSIHIGEQESAVTQAKNEIKPADQSLADEVESNWLEPDPSKPTKSEPPQFQQSKFSPEQPETGILEAKTPAVQTSETETETESKDYADSQDLTSQDSNSQDSATLNSEYPTDLQTQQPTANTNFQLDEDEPAANQDNSPSVMIANSDPKVEAARKQPELIADSWLNEEETKESPTLTSHEQPASEIRPNLDLEQQKEALIEEIKLLKIEKESLATQQNQVVVESLGVMIEEGTRELREQKKYLLQDIERLERRRERIRMEMRANFAGASQDLAMRVQGFKEYLVGSLQDLATAAERLELSKPEEKRRPRSDDSRDFREERSPRESRRPREGRLAREEREARESRESRRERSSREGRDSRDSRRSRGGATEMGSSPQFSDRSFSQQSGRIRQLLDRYRTQPDYYGPPWQLRRTFEAVHADRAQQWFFEQGGRGSIKGMGSRLQNILVASAITSVLYQLYRDRCRILVLVDSPEQLGEWRRGLQDCLGISRNDFGANRGVVLFESPEALMQRAERLLDDKLLPLIIIDESEGAVDMGLLRFPLWLAFAEKPQVSRSSGYLY